MSAAANVKAPPNGAKYAHAYAKLGWRVFPVRPRDKRPLVQDWPALATTDTEAIENWWSEWPDAGVAIATGRESGIWVLDIDAGKDGKDGDSALFALRQEHGDLPDTPEVLTGGGGRHLYFKWPPNGTEIRNSASKLGQGLDVRGNGGYVLAPGSTHPSGRQYEWEASSTPRTTPVAEAPDWLLKLVTATVKAAPAPRDGDRGKVREGGRNAHLASLAGAMRRQGAERDVLLTALQRENETKCSPPLPDEEVEQIAKSIGRYAPVERPETVAGPGALERLPGDWPEPESLPDGLPPVHEFDPVLLPDALRPWVCDIAERISCPLDYPAVGAMVALAAVVGRQIGIRPRLRDDWLVVPNLWGAIVGRPGLLKSPALAEVMKPLYRLEAAAREAHEEAQRDYEADCAVGKATAKDAERRIGEAVKKGNREAAHAIARAVADEEHEAPRRRQYMTSDATVEALGVLLAANPRGVLLFRDELTGWLRSLDREGREDSRAFFLEAWGGASRHTSNRIGRGVIDIEACCVSILGSIQPGPLGQYLRGVLDGGIGDDGLLQRLQLVVWPNSPNTWSDVDRWPDPQARNAAWEVYQRLDAINPEALGAQQGEYDEIPHLRFSGEAYELFRDWRAELEQRIRAGTEHPAFEAALSKQRSLVPSLALLLHLVDAPNGGPVSSPALVAAIAWAWYLESHARRLYAPALDPALHAARELDKHLRAGDLRSPFRARDAYLRGWSLLDKKGTAAALDYLEDLNRVRGEVIEPGARGGRPSTRWWINPKLEGRV